MAALLVNETGAREYLNNWQKSIPQKINNWGYSQLALSNVDNFSFSRRYVKRLAEILKLSTKSLKACVFFYYKTPWCNSWSGGNTLVAGRGSDRSKRDIERLVRFCVWHDS